MKSWGFRSSNPVMRKPRFLKLRRSLALVGKSFKPPAYQKHFQSFSPCRLSLSWLRTFVHLAASLLSTPFSGHTILRTSPNSVKPLAADGHPCTAFSTSLLGHRVDSSAT